MGRRTRARATGDPATHRRQTQERLIGGGFLVLLIAGGGLLGVLYGWQAAAVGAGIIAGGGLLLAVLWLGLHAAERWARGE